MPDDGDLPAPRTGTTLSSAARRVPSRAWFYVATAIGCALVVALTWASAELYESVKNAEGLATLDEPVLARAVAARTPTNVGVVNVLTQLGGGLWMTVITAAIVAIMTVRWRSRTPVIV